LTDHQAFLVRQPIFNAKLQIVAHAMLFRSQAGLVGADHQLDLLNSTRVIVSSMSHYGLDGILGKGDGFIQVTPDLIMSDTMELLPPKRFVLEISACDTFTEALLQRCRELRSKGFRLAIDDSVCRSQYDAILPVVDFVAIDLDVIPAESLFEVTKDIRSQFQVEFLAKNIRSEKMFACCTDLGFIFFQGSFFSEAPKVQGRKIHSQHSVLLRIVSELFKDGRVPEIELRFKEAPELILGLLRLVNSVGIGGGRVQITTLRQALVALGQKQLLRWIMLLIYTEKGDAASSALIFKVIQRARFMELLTQHPNFSYQGYGEQAHLVGMLSLTQDVVDIPLDVLLEEIGLAPQLRSALLYQEGALGQLLKLTVALEVADLVRVESVRHGLGISVQDITSVQLESIQWANELLHKMA